METTTLKTHIVFWVLPTLILLGLVAMYFSGNQVLMSILAPQFNRELGLLESVQHIILICIVVFLFKRARASRDTAERYLFYTLLAGAVFILLEELNYGTHYWWALTGVDWTSQPTISIHNRGDLSDTFKNIGDIVIVLFFVVFALVAARLDNKWVAYFRPEKMFILSVVCAVLVSRLAHYLNENHAPTPHYFFHNMGEFRETYVYYIGLLYCWTLCFKRRWPG